MDIPLATTFSAAVLFSLRWVRSGGRRGLLIAGVLLGFAMLAKGLVPLVLIAPLLWVAGRRWPNLFILAGAALVVALPWYVLCYIQNGDVFVKEFIWKHHISRFSSSDLQHVQPWWFYIPVLLGLLFPWSATVALLPQRVDDNRRKLLLLIVVFGFVFFSAATNKLPGYLLPSTAADRRARRTTVVGGRQPTSVYPFVRRAVVITPVRGGTLPLALAQGLSSVPIVAADWWAVVPIIAALAFAILFLRKGRRTYAIATTVMAATFGVTYLKVRMFPVLDQVVSARPQWLLIRNAPDEYCAGDLHRNHRYGLNYYTRTPLPTCESQARPETAGALNMIISIEILEIPPS